MAELERLTVQTIRNKDSGIDLDGARLIMGVISTHI